MMLSEITKNMPEYPGIYVILISSKSKIEPIRTDL